VSTAALPQFTASRNVRILDRDSSRLFIAPRRKAIVDFGSELLLPADTRQDKAVRRLSPVWRWTFYEGLQRWLAQANFGGGRSAFKGTPAVISVVMEVSGGHGSWSSPLESRPWNGYSRFRGIHGQNCEGGTPNDGGITTVRIAAGDEK
jgi:hypothetical protein